ncbi:MAG: hypothetical protein FWE18_00190 [Alphaproteobacteria bacterium]|nr:hypothetical protein [Alphaproteobacteria bacterium]
MKLLGIDVLKGYVGCFGAKIAAFVNKNNAVLFQNSPKFEGNVILDTPTPYTPLGAWQGKLVVPLVSNFCFIQRQPTIRREWNDTIKRQIMNVDVVLKIAPTISSNALMEYMGIDSSKNIANNVADLNNIQNPFLLLASTMLAQRQRTPLTYLNIGDMYYIWQVITPNIAESDLFLTNYSIDYQTGDVLLNLTSYVAPSIRGQAEPTLYQSLQAGGGFS